MANGFRCKVCGYQETAHLFPEYADEEDTGHELCGRFRLSKKDLIENNEIERKRKQIEIERGMAVAQTYYRYCELRESGEI